MNRLTAAKRVAVVRCLVEGTSIRATVRITGVAKNTVTKLLVDLGAACSEHQDRALRNLRCQHVEADEIWSFCNAKARNVPDEHRGDREWGDVWTWVAIDADTKLVPSWAIGDRSASMAMELTDDLAKRLASRIQLTTDGHHAYWDAVDGTWATNVDYAQLVKIYGADPSDDQKRYSPAKCLGADVRILSGSPDPENICTSHIERQNLTMRMSMRRFTRLTNAFSRKVENLAAAVSLHVMYYNFARPHQGLPYPRTPAMAAGVSDHVWKIEEIVALLGR
ncbi:MAG: IS1 family transposase [Candidatus Dormibacteria bacterium]